MASTVSLCTRAFSCFFTRSRSWWPTAVWLQEPGRKLVEQRLERVVVVLVHDHDLDVRFRECVRRADAGEPAAQDENAVPSFRHWAKLGARRGVAVTRTG